jgi:hypothetical protein
MLLALPDLRQDTPHGCGEAAVRCILAYHQILATIPRFATPQDGADPRQLEACLRRLGLRVLSGEMKAADLRHFCDTSRPVPGPFPGRGDRSGQLHAPSVGPGLGGRRADRDLPKMGDRRLAGIDPSQEPRKCGKIHRSTYAHTLMLEECHSCESPCVP